MVDDLVPERTVSHNDLFPAQRFIDASGRYTGVKNASGRDRRLGV